MTKTKLALMTAFGAGLLALPFAMPSTAQADDFRISLNLGGGAPVYYSQPVYRAPVYHPAPQRIVYVQQPRRIVYASRPVYRQRVVYNNGWRGNGHGNNNHGGWNNHDRNVAWR